MRGTHLKAAKKQRESAQDSCFCPLSCPVHTPKPGSLISQLVFNSYVAEDDLEFLIHLLPPKFWDYKHVMYVR